MNYLYLILALYLVPLLAYIIYRISFNKYNEEGNNKELSGFEVARKALDTNNLEGIYIVEKKGAFTDTYDYKQDVIRLSSPTFHKESIYAMSLSSFIASKMILYKKEDKVVKTKIILDNFINVITLLLYVIFLIGLITDSLSAYKIVFDLLLGIIVYKILTIPIDSKIIDYSYEQLQKNKYINKKNNDSITKFNSVLKLLSFIQIVIILSNLFYYIKDEINNSRK